MILLPPVPAPKIKGIDPEMLKVHSVFFFFLILYVMADDVTGNGCFISLLYVISNVTAEWIVLHGAVITAAHTCFEC